ncbi:carbohydrate ABC transporter permease [Neorhizobium petrolearium]|uniref:Sugar ABC transporter permease n=1 Tax=Neorhizobium petrolearium TaxID=515361 RepID=A0ABY8MBJ5_9HYPH|nr:sugar ABC transporter permease [Neorhizobium petrolearium]MCC2613578.1 sugar ABC transporter permease [Neorhizobium petrolearium]WGI71896.1 sugar ABC transporter permease [Neorhizobium petrolearium]
MMKSVPPAKTDVSRSRWRDQVGDLFERWSFLMPSVLVLTVMLAYPIFYTIEISFASFDIATFGAGEWIGWANYEEVIGDYRFWDSLQVTLIYLVIALPLQVTLGFGIAFLINAEWWGRSALRALFIIPMVVAPVVAGGMWRMILDPLWGIMNYWMGLAGIGSLDWFGDPKLAMAAIIIIDTWRWTPFIVLIATAALLALPKDVFEAAKIDGANWWSTLWSVAVPLLVPIIAATFVIRWLGAVKMFDIVLAATYGGPGKATNIINLFIYEEAFRSLRFAESAAMAVIVLVLTMVLTGIFLRGSRKLEELF